MTDEDSVLQLKLASDLNEVVGVAAIAWHIWPVHRPKGRTRPRRHDRIRSFETCLRTRGLRSATYFGRNRSHARRSSPDLRSPPSRHYCARVRPLGASSGIGACYHLTRSLPTDGPALWAGTQITTHSYTATLCHGTLPVVSILFLITNSSESRPKQERPSCVGFRGASSRRKPRSFVLYHPESRTD